MKKNCLLFFFTFTVSIAVFSQTVISIIPQPVKIEMKSGEFRFGPETKIMYMDESLMQLAQYARQQWKFWSGWDGEIQQIKHEKLEGNFVLQIIQPAEKELSTEGYGIEITSQNVFLRSNTQAGLIYAIQTLNQLMSANPSQVLPACIIIDYPRFRYRGLHLDVARHFMPADFIYRLLDEMAFHKMNVFHWHLVDDQGWRLEIEKYPKLTSIGAWRPDMEDLDWNARPLQCQPTQEMYGGFYTQDEVRKIVKYAADRNITIIPEIEMPAHVMSALAAYPQFSCSGKNLGVPSGSVWPITHIYCAGNDSTFIFLRDVLTEVMEMFPSIYIHIGGDEADKSEWNKCPKCQQRMQTENLKNVDELQSYFVQCIEKFLNANGRIMIGWDEILEGGLAPNVVVMSWRGEEGGIAAARLKHNAIMTPASHCYFDYYQGDPAVEPLSIGGYIPLKRVYSYEPVPQELSLEESHYILGAQANTWTEYIRTPQHAEYMIFPRLAALAEVVWSPNNLRNWEDFSRRLENQFKCYDKLGIYYARSAFQARIISQPDSVRRCVEISIETEAPYGEIHYTTNGKDPTDSSPVYTGPFALCESATVKAGVFHGGKCMGAIIAKKFSLHKAFGVKMTFQIPSASRYNGNLGDGVWGSTNYRDGNWKGFLGDDAIIIIDLGKPTKIRSIKVDALQASGSWIFFPEKAICELSKDGKEWKSVGEKMNEHSWQEPVPAIQLFGFENLRENVRFVRLKMKNRGTCPLGHAGEGQPAWIFISEVEIL